MERDYKKILNSQTSETISINNIREVIPELFENEDERIRKEIVDYLRKFIPHHDCDLVAKSKVWIAWLEKQGEQNHYDEVMPKFNVGDWITNSEYTWKVTAIHPLDYILQSQNGDTVDDTISHVDEHFHLWTIQDAKDGDVLASNHSIFIFSQGYMAGKPEVHCGIMNGLFIAKPKGCWTNEKCYPATKEQRDLLFQKMKEAGYEWIPEKKELKMIKPDFQKIQWKGNNLKEIVEFTGKSPKFNDWFKTWEEYENYVHTHNNIFKLFNEDGSHFEVPVGAWIVKTPDGYNIASKSTFIQKHTWSEEDDYAIEKLFCLLDTEQDNYPQLSCDFQEIEGIKDWLKSLKNRVIPQPMQEWSEEDNEKLNSIIEVLGNDSLLVQWLKSLKPQSSLYDKGYNDGYSAAKYNSWKPSEEQMKWLKDVIETVPMTCRQQISLESLYNDLKKL